MSNQLKISMDLLESAGACSGQLELFKKFLGKRKFIRVTERNAHLAQKFGLNVGWAIRQGWMPRELACRNAKWAYRYALTAVCQDTMWVYASNIYNKPSDDTRSAACGDPQWAYAYALMIDGKPRDDTRSAACGDAYWAYRYAVDIDHEPRNDTRKAACGDPRWAYQYAMEIDHEPRDNTRKAACGDPEWADLYARNVDKK